MTHHARTISYPQHRTVGYRAVLWHGQGGQRHRAPGSDHSFIDILTSRVVWLFMMFMMQSRVAWLIFMLKKKKNTCIYRPAFRSREKKSSSSAPKQKAHFYFCAGPRKPRDALVGWSAGKCRECGLCWNACCLPNLHLAEPSISLSRAGIWINS
jgi:hypothetical protein